MKPRIYIFILALAAIFAAPASATEPARTETSVSARPGGVEISNPADATVGVEVYAITGSLIRRADAPAGTSRIELPPGCYIVRVDGLSRRVAVR